MTMVKASARKSLGEYKPLIVYPNGKTEVVEQSADRFDRYTKKGVIPGNKMARGTTYSTKQDAVAAAQQIIHIRREDAERRYNENVTIAGREDFCRRVLIEARLWQSKM